MSYSEIEETVMYLADLVKKLRDHVKRLERKIDEKDVKEEFLAK